MCIDNHYSSDRRFLLMTCINSVYFNIISQGFLLLTAFTGGKKIQTCICQKNFCYVTTEKWKGFERRKSHSEPLPSFKTHTEHYRQKQQFPPKPSEYHILLNKANKQKKTWSQKPLLLGKWLDWSWLQKQNTFPGRQPKSLLLHCCQDMFWLKVFWGNGFSCFGFSPEYT